MRFSGVCLESIGYALPPEVWSSAYIEEVLAPVYERLRLPQGRLELMTGIEERRFWPRGFQPSQASAEAGKVVLEKSSVDKEDIDLLIHSAVCRDRLEPATAAYVHDYLKLPRKTQILDVSNACLGFLNAIVLASGLIQSGQIKHALIVSGENGRPLVENTLRRLQEPDITRKSIKPYFANLTIGSGAVAAVLSAADEISTPLAMVEHAMVETDSTANRLCQGDSAADELEMQTDSEALLEAGLLVARRCWDRLTSENGWNTHTPQKVITHQVGKVHRRRLYETLGLDVAKDFSSFSRMGNVGSVSLPVTLAMAHEAGALKDVKDIALLGIGSGLSSIMMTLDWRAK